MVIYLTTSMIYNHNFGLNYSCKSSTNCISQKSMSFFLILHFNFGIFFLKKYKKTACFLFCFFLLQYLEEEYRKGAREDDPMPPVQPYHYGSHYSNSGTVLHFLVRMPPFTKMFLAYQGTFSYDVNNFNLLALNRQYLDSRKTEPRNHYKYLF